MKNPDKKSFNILLDPATYDQLTQLAIQSEVSRGAVVRAAIRYHHKFLQHARESGQTGTGGTLEIVNTDEPEPQLAESA